MILGKEIFLAHGLRMQEPGFGKLDDTTKKSYHVADSSNV